MPVSDASLGAIDVPDVPGVEALRLTVDGVGLRVLVAGDPKSQPLMLLHGIAGSAGEWLEVMPQLAMRYRTVAADAPGHGFSDKPGDLTYGVDLYAQSVLGIMDALGIARAPLVAISGGGTVALKIALNYPDRISKLVLVDAAGLGRQGAWSYRLATLPLMKRAFRRSTTPRSVEAFGRALLVQRDRLPHGWVERRRLIWATEGALDAFFGTVRTSLSLLGQRVEFTNRLHEVRQTSLIVWGRQDPIIPVAHGISAAQGIPHAKLHIFERCGHMPIWEYPQEFARVVNEFLG